MDEFTQSMLDRARQRRELLAARMATEEANSPRKRPVGVNNENEIRNGVPVDDDSPSKRLCYKDTNSTVILSSPSKMEVLSANLGGSSPHRTPHKSRFAALADSINSWEDDSSAKKEKRQAPLAPIVNNQLNVKPVADVSSAPPKPPRMLELDERQYENVTPCDKLTIQRDQKYPAPVAPEIPAIGLTVQNVAASPVAKASPAKTSAEESGHVSSAKLILGNSHKTESPLKVSVTPIKQSTASPAKAAATPARLTTGVPAKFNDSFRPQAAKRTVVTAVSKTISSEHDNSHDSSINEPTKQPVSVRLAAWQSKQTEVSSQDPLPVTSRVKNYENKVGAGEQRFSSKTVAHLRSKTEGLSPTSRSVAERFSPRNNALTGEDKPSPRSVNRVPSANTKGSYAARSPSGRAIPSSTVSRRPSNKAVLEVVIGRSPSGKGGNSPSSKSRLDSPVKVGTSPQKLAPATRAVQEKLIQLIESNTKNEAVERERQQRAAEIQALGNRWTSQPEASSANSGDVPASIPLVAPPLPPSGTTTPSRNVASPSTDCKNTANKVASPRSTVKDPRREAARDKMRTEFESKLLMMGFDVNADDNTATAELKKSVNVVSSSMGHRLVQQSTAPVTTPIPVKTNSILGLSTPKASNSISAPVVSKPGGSSLYSLIKKQSMCKTPTVPTSSFPKPVGSDNDEHDSFDDDDDDDEDDEDYIGRKTDSHERVQRQNTVTFAHPIDEYAPSDCNQSTDSSIQQSSEVGDQTMESITTETDSRCDETLEDAADDEFNSEEENSEEEDEDDDEDDCSGEVNDLLDKALTDEPSVTDKKQSIPEEPAVVMRKKSVKRLSSGNKGFISLQEYRRQTARPASQMVTSGGRSPVARNVITQNTASTSASSSPGFNKHDKQTRHTTHSGDKRQNIVSPRKNLVTVMRQSDVSRHAEDDLLPFIPDKPVKQRLQELQDMVNQELNIIQQTSNALNQCCHSNSAFAGSAEAVECHRLLLVACKKREAYMIEMQKLREGHPITTNSVSGPQGRLTISDIKLPLKSDFMSKIGSTQDLSVFYFMVMIRHGSHIIFTQMVSTHDVMVRGSLDFPNLINLNHVTQDFVVDVEIYGMSVTKILETQTPKKKSKVASCTPKKLMTPKSSKLFQNPAGPYAVRTSNFVHVASLQLTKAQLMKSQFALDRIPYSFPLQGSIQMRLSCLMQSNIEERGFLTMFEDVSGFGAWHRRWCVLINNVIAFWKYPDDEKEKDPIGVIELKRCITDEVGLVSRDACARPNTFELKTVRRQQQGERDTLVTSCYDTTSITKHWLSADTKEERLVWLNRLNDALTSLRAWHADALKPVKRTAQENTTLGNLV